jgi:hypothetical protein
MALLRELFTTDIGLLSLAVLAFIVGMAVWFARFFRSRIREELASRTVATPAGADAPQR